MGEDRDIAKEEGGKFLTHLLSNTNLTMSQIYANVTELLLAGVDTVRNIGTVFMNTMVSGVPRQVCEYQVTACELQFY